MIVRLLAVFFALALTACSVIPRVTGEMDRSVVGRKSAVPTATISIGGTEQRSVVGGFCWDGLCADPGLWPSPRLPLRTKSPVEIRLSLPTQAKVRHVEYGLTRVTVDKAVQQSTAPEVFYWPSSTPFVSGVTPVSAESLQTWRLELAPGLYFLTVFAWWTGPRDATHGFLFEVVE